MQRDIALKSALDLSHARTTNEHNGSDPLWRTTQLFDPKLQHTDQNLPLAELSGIGVITSPTGVWYSSKEIVDGVFHWKSTSSQKIAPAVVTLVHNIAHKLVREELKGLPQTHGVPTVLLMCWTLLRGYQCVLRPSHRQQPEQRTTHYHPTSHQLFSAELFLNEGPIHNYKFIFAIPVWPGLLYLLCNGIQWLINCHRWHLAWIYMKCGIPDYVHPMLYHCWGMGSVSENWSDSG